MLSNVYLFHILCIATDYLVALYALHYCAPFVDVRHCESEWLILILRDEALAREFMPPCFPSCFL